jgi:pimeloyl-ACP methyl ester carboxylesterase
MDVTTTGTPGDLHFIDNGAGWRIALKRVAPSHAASAKLGKLGKKPRPVLIVPGYGMNSFIFGFHPRGLSLEAYLASRGLETWSVDLRGQGRSVREHGSERYGLAELAIDDLSCAIGHVTHATRTGHEDVDIIGCSLGASLAFAHLACVPDAPVHTMISMGGLVTWVKVHAVVRAAFAWPWLVERVRMKDTRRLAGRALPALVRWAPRLLSIYLNAASTDTTHAATMIQTVEDPNPFVNREIADWIKRRDLIVRGVNVSTALRGMKHPLLCVVARNDGIVPPETSRAIYSQIGSTDKALLEVGDPTAPIAHADLFLSNDAQERIFARVAEFLLARE